jgi:hypothetical protein
MMKLNALPYKYDFYWKGNRYIQVIRPKKPIHNAFKIVCRPYNDPCAKWIDFPSGRAVKPVCSINEFMNKITPYKDKK